MSIRVECPGCSKTIKAPEKYAGKTAKCPGCGEKIAIPVAVNDSSAALTAAPPKVPALPETITSKPCPFCAETIQTTAKKCKHCGEFLDGRATTIEKTSKKWKIAQLIAGIGLVIGIGLLALGLSNGAQQSSTTTGFGPVQQGVVCILVSLPIMVVARIGAWWYHG